MGGQATGIALVTTLSLSTEHDTLEEFEGALAVRVHAGAVFLPAPCDAPVGERVNVEMKLASGDVALAFQGHVAWRYPPDAVPPGREAGVGVVVEKASDETGARLARVFERAEEGAERSGSARALRRPGAWLAPRTREDGWLRAPRGVRAAKNAAETGLEDARADVPAEEPALDDGPYARFPARMPTSILEEHARRSHQTSAEGEPRPLPEPPPPEKPLPRPTLRGAFFVYADARGRAGAVKRLERFGWPVVGTQRLPEDDARYQPPGDLEDDDTAPWDEITDSQRASSRWEVSDPGRRMTDIVSRALDDMADVDGALGESLPDSAPDGDARASRSGRGRENGARRAPEAPFARGPASERLPVGLRLRVEERPVETLWAAGEPLPASRTMSFAPEGPPAEGAEGAQASVRVALFEGDREGDGRHLGTVHVRVPSGRSSISVRFDVRSDGFVEVRSIDDGSVAERWRTSWAQPAPYPRPVERRGWRRWLRSLSSRPGCG